MSRRLGTQCARGAQAVPTQRSVFVLRELLGPDFKPHSAPGLNQYRGSLANVEASGEDDEYDALWPRACFFVLSGGRSVYGYAMRVPGANVHAVRTQCTVVPNNMNGHAYTDGSGKMPRKGWCRKQHSEATHDDAEVSPRCALCSCTGFPGLLVASACKSCLYRVSPLSCVVADMFLYAWADCTHTLCCACASGQRLIISPAVCYCIIVVL